MLLYAKLISLFLLGIWARIALQYNDPIGFLICCAITSVVVVFITEKYKGL